MNVRDLSRAIAERLSVRVTRESQGVQTMRHIEKAKHGEKILLIGPVTAVRDKAVAVHCFDSCGKWDRKPVLARYDRISEIQFDSEYINVWSRHIGIPPAGERKA